LELQGCNALLAVSGMTRYNLRETDIMQERLQGKTALVTGGSKRIGKAICLSLAAAGANVVFTYRQSLLEAEETAAEMEHRNVGVLAIQAELTDLSACDQVIAKATETFGQVDILVNNASDFPRTPLADLSRDRDLLERQSDYLYRLHVLSPLYLGMQLGLRMKQRGWGRIVNLTDRVTAKGQAYRNWPLYIASKYGLYGVTQVLAEELRPEVTVNSIAPGLVIPPPDFTPEQVRVLYEKIPLRRQVSVEEIAADVLHLINSDAKTGSIILSDGGAGLHTY
jgi:pteridine reductase